MRSAKETGCFPYRSSVVCFMELFPNGELNQLASQEAKLEAYFNATKEKSKIVAVWPGQWRSDLFIIDDLDEYFNELNLLKTYEQQALRNPT